MRLRFAQGNMEIPLNLYSQTFPPAGAGDIEKTSPAFRSRTSKSLPLGEGAPVRKLGRMREKHESSANWQKMVYPHPTSLRSATFPQGKALREKGTVLGRCKYS